MLDAFVAAARHGDVAALEGVLSADVVAYADGNGLRGVARLEVVGAQRVAGISAFVDRLIPGARFAFAEVNGLPGVLVRRGGETVGSVSATLGADGMDGLYRVPAPEKLRAYERSSDRLARREP
ncbi:hypothetical protein ACIQJT_02740 [Streptomyces sp. NPDC091972]|uniref:hypothetical protein n=1 Tax=Streptomyces sp. NPDC091972 TaxID=3366007 RepID=UPI00382F0728